MITLSTVMSSSTVLILLSILILYCSSESCDMAKECPTDNNVTWASNRTECHVFRNQCLLNNVNCHRQNNNETKLEIVTKDECQLLCKTKCPHEDDDEPLCGYDNAQRHTFANQCEMEAYICKTGEPFFVYGLGPCESPDAKIEEDVKEEDEEEGALSS